MTAVEFKDVTISRDDLVVLEEVSARIEEGVFLGLIGPNGGGKTTFLKAILGLIQPDRGTVRVYGKHPEQARRRGFVGYVPQNALVDFDFPVSAFDVVMMGRYPKVGLFHRPGKGDRERVMERLEQVGMAELRDRPIGRLSGGQQQRVFIARALVSDPRILLLDEPLTGIDTRTQKAFYELLKTLGRSLSLTVIMASHDIGVIPHQTDEVACVNRRLHLHGKPSEVLTADGLKKVYGCEVELLVHGKIPHRVVQEHDE
jgi:zinc transport system ATP-binding protein